MLEGKKILLCISGSIAAYKAILLTRLLIKEAAEVQIICTPAALHYVSAPTLSTLSKKPVHSDFYTNTKTGTWVNHVELGKWADLIVIAPATASTISKLVSGHCDNLLIATYLSATCPVMLAPAMDLDMYAHHSTQENLEKLKSRNVQILEADSGELASGLEGQGRLKEPEEILEIIENHFQKSELLKGKNVLVTAGPTHEAIDPVRFIGNHSSGKMGVAIANYCASLGASVTLILGPSARHRLHESIKTIDVVSASDMKNSVDTYFPSADFVFKAAAVADFRPKSFAQEKIKKQVDFTNIELEKTDDILKGIGAKKQEHQKIIGFALETENELENAKNKLQRKNLDALVLNSLKDEGAGFGFDTNKIKFLTKNGEIFDFPLKSKQEIAKDIVKEALKLV